MGRKKRMEGTAAVRYGSVQNIHAMPYLNFMEREDGFVACIARRTSLDMAGRVYNWCISMAKFYSLTSSTRGGLTYIKYRLNFKKIISGQ